MGVASMMSLSGAVDMAGTAGTLFSGLSIHTHTCAYYKVRAYVCVEKMRGAFTVPFVPAELFI